MSSKIYPVGQCRLVGVYSGRRPLIKHSKQTCLSWSTFTKIRSLPSVGHWTSYFYWGCWGLRRPSVKCLHESWKHCHQWLLIRSLAVAFVIKKNMFVLLWLRWSTWRLCMWRLECKGELLCEKCGLMMSSLGGFNACRISKTSKSLNNWIEWCKIKTSEKENIVNLRLIK